MNSHTAHETGLDNYERNHWFRGKMVTARDLDAEWAYHADRLNTLARLTVGEGIVCGLETTVTQTNPTTLAVDVSAGVGIDSTGRHVVVRRPATRDVTIGRTQTEVSLYLTYRECGKESVPAFDGISACEDDRCEYNRVLETFELHAGPRPPDDYGHVRPLRFPSLEAFPEGFESLAQLRSGGSGTETGDETGNGNGNGNGDENGTGSGGQSVDSNAVQRTLSELSRSYNGVDGDPDGPLVDCRSTKGPLDRVDDGTQRQDQPAVFVGTFTEGDSGWSRDEAVPLKFVATNDMLHDGLADHAAQFDNPHHVRLDAGVETAKNRGVLFTDQRSRPVPLFLSSPDRDIEYGYDRTTRTVELSVPTLDQHDTRITALEQSPEFGLLRRYVFDKTMKYTLASFRDVAEAFEGRLVGDLATEIASRTLTGVDQRWYADAEAFASYLFDENVLPLPERVTGSITSGVLTLTEPDPDGGNGAQLTYEVDLSTQVFDAPDVTDGRVTLTTSVFGLETLLVDLFEPLVGDLVSSVALERYRKALAEFDGVDKPGPALRPADDAYDSTVLRLAILQDQLCEAVDWMVEADDAEPTGDTRPIGFVFRGQEGVDLRLYRGAPTDADTGTLFSITDPTADSIEVDLDDETIEPDRFAAGSYSFSPSLNPTSIVVSDPEIDGLSLTLRGEDATLKPIPAETDDPLVVRASFDFSSVEGLQLSVTNEAGDEEFTDDLTGDPHLDGPDDEVELDVSGLDVGAYTVTVRGESMFEETTRSVGFSVVDAAIDLTLNPTKVAQEEVTTGRFTSSVEGQAFVLVARDGYENPGLFDRLSKEEKRRLLKLIFDGQIADVGVNDEYVFAELALDGGDAVFEFSSAGLRASDPRTGAAGVVHPIIVSRTPDISSPPGRVDQREILATAKLFVVPRRVRDFTDIPDRFVDPSDLVFTDPGGRTVLVPSDGSDFVTYEPPDDDRFGTGGRIDWTDVLGGGSRFGSQVLSGGGTTSTTLDRTNVLDDITGIGDVRARLLVEAGVTDLTTLAETDSERLAEVADVSLEMAESWQAEARDRIGQ